MVSRLPDGQITCAILRTASQVPFRKIFRLTRRANQRYQLARLTRQEGRLAIVTKRAVGCGGRNARARRTRVWRTAKSCGPDARCWRQVGGCASIQLDRARYPAGDGGNKAGHRGEHEGNRKTIAQGKPGCLRWTCMLVCAFLCALRTRDRGCSAHPAFPAPSVRRARKLLAKLGRTAPRDRESVSADTRCLTIESVSIQARATSSAVITREGG